MRLSGKLVLTALFAVAAVLGTASVSIGAGSVSVSKPLVKGNGTAVLPVTVSQPGTVVLWDAASLRPCGGPPRIRRVEFQVQQPETLKMPVKPTHLIKPALKSGQRVKVSAEVDFTPAGATTVAEKQVRPIVLRIDAKNAAAAATRRCGPEPPASP
jgi:hypothetical protein